IAHDFNNLLTPIMGYISLAIHESEQNDNVSSYLQEALGSADHARHLIQQILAFTRNTGPAEEVVHVASLAQEAMRLLRASIPTTIKIIEEIDPDSGSVLADSTQIHQILINLGTNAYHAIGTTGGTIRLKIEDEPQDKEAGEDHAGTQAYLRIEVSDTGHGIDPEIRERIFDPYFTTKIKQGGTGLGLSMVHNIVKNFGGKISVESDPQTGTKFIILLPRIPESERPTKEDVNETLLPGTENIWVVDDDEMVLLMETRLLKELGYQVKGFLDSTEALNYFTAHTSEVDVLITDLTMPVMTGETLAQKVQAIRPELPIILCSGNSERINQEIAENIQIARFVQKPFMPAYLAQIIRDVLSSKEGQNEAIK
ncbi:response regulator, partial [Myxococcota bacterium]|nr:response regulator [Myxococcota bacterium]